MGQDIQINARGTGAVPVTIAAGQSLSPEIDTEGFELTGLAVPLGFSGSQITFAAAERPGGTFLSVRDTGAEVVVNVAAGRIVAIGATTTLASLRHLKVRAGTAASPTTQGSNVRLLLLRKQGA